MSSDRAHLIQKYNSLNDRLNEHIARLDALSIQQKFHMKPDAQWGEGFMHPRNVIGATQMHKSLAMDIASFWNEMCKVNDQCKRRTGRGIDAHEDTYDHWHQKIKDILEYSRQTISGGVL